MAKGERVTTSRQDSLSSTGVAMVTDMQLTNKTQLEHKSPWAITGHIGQVCMLPYPTTEWGEWTMNVHLESGVGVWSMPMAGSDSSPLAGGPGVPGPAL